MPTQNIDGPVVTTSGGTKWHSRIALQWEDPGTATMVQVWYTYKFILLQGAVNDSGNLISWTDPWGSGAANNRSIVISGSGEVVVGGTYTQWHSINYGASTRMDYSLSIDNIGPGDTGPSVASGSAWIGPRVVAPPSAPVVAHRSLSARSVNIYVPTPGDENGAGADDCEYRIHGGGYGPHGVSYYGSYVGGVTLGLTPATYYEVIARAHNSAGWGPWSPAIGFTAPADTPDTPATPSLSNITSNNIRVNGAVPSNNGSAIVEYQFQRATNSAFTAGVSSPTHSGHILDMGGLNKATTYWFRYRARNGIGWSNWSAAVSGKTLATAPVISGYSTNAVTRNSFTVSSFVVSDNGGEAPSNVRVEHNTSASSTGSSIVTRGSWGDVTISGRAADTPYYYRASVWNSAGWSAWGTWKSVRTLLGVPNDMAAPTISNITDTSARMNWAAGSANGATFVHYEYQVAFDQNFDNVILTGTTTELFANLTFAEPGQTRYVRVRMIATPNSGGWSPGTLMQMTGIAPGSGLRMYTFVGGVRKQLDLYTFVNGQRKKLKTFAYINGQWEKE